MVDDTLYRRIAWTCSAKWQATMPPDGITRSGGSTSAHVASAYGHLGWKRHPDGGVRALGTSPVSGRRVSGAPGREGSTAASSACVYGCIGAE
jgi:hypothetical protein